MDTIVRRLTVAYKVGRPDAHFVPVRLPEPVAPTAEIRLEVRRGATTITVTWPVAAAAECAIWMRELLR